MKKIIILFSLISLFGFEGFAKDLLKLRSSVLESHVGVNDSFNIRVTVDIPFAQNKNNEPLMEITPTIPEGFKFLRASPISQDVIPDTYRNKLTFIKRYQVTLQFKALKKGRYTKSFANIKTKDGISPLPAEYIVVEGRSYARSRLNSRKSGKIKFYTAITNKTPYVGEYVKVTLKLFLPHRKVKYNMEFQDAPASNNAYIKSFYTYSDKDPKRKVGRAGIEVTLEELLIYPLKSGEIEISPRRLKLTENGVVRILKHPPVKFTAKPVPEKLSGVFKASTELTPLSVKVGDILLYSLVIKGTGNLITYELPADAFANSENLELVKKDDSFEFTSKNLRHGVKKFIYTFRLLDNERISDITIPYFNTKTEKTMKLIFKAPTLSMLPANEVASEQSDDSEAAPFKISNKTITVVLSLIGLLLFFIIIVKLFVSRLKNINFSPSKKTSSKKTKLERLQELRKQANEELKANNPEAMYNTLFQLLSVLSGDSSVNPYEGMVRMYVIKEQYYLTGIRTLVDKIQNIRFSKESMSLSKNEAEDDLNFVVEILNKIKKNEWTS